MITLPFTWLRIKFRILINRIPRRIRLYGGPILGGLIGIIGGIPGVIIGILLGYLVGELFKRAGKDQKIIEYFENPGPQQFYEGESGLAAWCALGVLIASEESTVPLKELLEGHLTERILRKVILQACYVFHGPLTDPFLIEHFSRLAWTRRQYLNPDLLAESFASRRAALGDAGNKARGLSILADGRKAKTLAREIRLLIDPASKDEERESSLAENQQDPWKILGLPPGTPLKEVKTHYRTLAKQFHPDELGVLDEQRRATAARAFIAIKEAYRQIADDN